MSISTQARFDGLTGKDAAELIGANASAQKPRHPRTDVPDEFDPNSLPVEPDELPEPTHIPDDPELDAVVNPED